MSPHLRGRIDIDKFNKGLQRMENFLPSIQGPTDYRQGLEWIADSTEGNIRLIEFTVNNQNRYLLALSAGLLQVYSTDGTLLLTRGGGVDVSGTPLPADNGFGVLVTIPYLDDQIMDVRYSSEVEVMIFTHPLHKPYELVINTVYEVLQLFSAQPPDEEGVQLSGAGTTAVNGFYVRTIDDEGGKGKYLKTNPPGRNDVISWNPGESRWECFRTGFLDQNYINQTDSISPEIGTWEVWPGGVGIAPAPTAELLPPNFPLADSAGSTLYAGAASSSGLIPWDFKPVEFTSHPFQMIDTSDTVLKVSNEVERVRLISSIPDWTFGDVDKYTEYKVGNQWSLGKIVEFVNTTEVLVDPVESVVNMEDPSVRLALFDNRDPINPTDSAKGWLDRDGVAAGETHVRADTLVFRTSHIGAWIRIGDNRLFTNVCDPVASAAFNSQDGKIRWGKIIDSRGLEDHPVEFITGPLAVDAFDAGSVYEVYEWGPVMTELDIRAPSGSPATTAKVLKSGGTWRFSMNHLFIQTPASSSTELTILANMSNQIQFDVVEVGNGNNDTEPLLVSGSNLISPNGDVTAYDLVTDPRRLNGEDGTYATHTATLTSSRIFFDEARDAGRYVLGNLVNRWVLMQIKHAEDISPYSVEVDVLSSIPRDELTDEIKNNGVFIQFRLGAWYEGNYPAAVSFYEQRRVFAGSVNHPNLVWLSNFNDPTDFRTVEDNGQVIDTTGITYQLGTGSTIITWLDAGPTLVVGTESSEWQLRPNEFSAAITPSNIRITQETSIGSRIQGRRIGNAVFFPHISGKHLHEFKFDFQTQQFVVDTVTKLVPNLFESDPIRSMSFQFYPNSSIWIVTQGGQLLSLTHRKEEDYYAWSKHTTLGLFKDVVVVPKGDSSTSEDQVWFIVQRGGTNMLEKMATSFTDSGVDDLKRKAAFLDSFARTPKEGSLTGPATTVSVPARCIVGGKAAIVVDGVYLGLVDVTVGENSLGSVVANDYILVGLPYTGVLQMNPQAFDAQGKNAYGQIKRIVSMRPYLYKSMGYSVGFSMDNLEEIQPSGGVSLFTGYTEEHTILDSNFDVDEIPLIVQDKPYPLTIVSNVITTDLH